MAFEQVTPTGKGGQDAAFVLEANLSLDPTFSTDGSKLLFLSRAALDPSRSLQAGIGDAYVAARSPQGWTTSSTAAPVGLNGSIGPTFIFTSQLDRWFDLLSTNGQGDRGWFAAYEGTESGWIPRSEVLKATNLAALEGNRPQFLSDFVGAAADLSHVFIRLPINAATLIPGDPAPAGSASQANTYVIGRSSGGGDTLELLARDGSGVRGDSCGAWVGGGEGIGGTRGGREQGAVSGDGKRVFFSTRNERPAHSNLTSCDPENQIRIHRRDVAGDVPSISEVTPTEPQTGNDLFQGASADGNLVYFTTTRSLAATDLDSPPPGANCSATMAVPACDLYAYDALRPEGQRFVQVSAGTPSGVTPGEGAAVISGVSALSTDGSNIYFVATDALTSDPNPAGATANPGELNLYAYERPAGAAPGQLGFVGGLDPSDLGALFGVERSFRSAEAVPMIGAGASGGSGDVFVFATAAALNAEDVDGVGVDIYRYDGTDVQAELICVSCRPGGDDEPFNVSRHEGAARESFRLSQFERANRWVSEDGDTIAFSTAQSLVDEDADEAENVYFWHRDGLGQQVYLLPSAPPQIPVPSQVAVSGDGGSIAFETTARLTPSDGDLARDLYVARADGGFEQPPSQIPCKGDGCQASPENVMAPPIPASAAFAGKGNVKQKPRTKCRRGFKLKKGKCVPKARGARKKGAGKKRKAAIESKKVWYRQGGNGNAH